MGEIQTQAELSSSEPRIHLDAFAALILGNNKIQLDSHYLTHVNQQRAPLITEVGKVGDSVSAVHTTTSNWWEGSSYSAVSDVLTAISIGKPASLSQYSEDLSSLSSDINALSYAIEHTKDEMNRIVIHAYDQVLQLGVDGLSASGEYSAAAITVIENARQAVDNLILNLVNTIASLRDKALAELPHYREVSSTLDSSSLVLSGSGGTNELLSPTPPAPQENPETSPPPHNANGGTTAHPDASGDSSERSREDLASVASDSMHELPSSPEVPKDSPRTDQTDSALLTGTNPTMMNSGSTASGTSRSSGQNPSGSDRTSASSSRPTENHSGESPSTGTLRKPPSEEHHPAGEPNSHSSSRDNTAPHPSTPRPEQSPVPTHGESHPESPGRPSPTTPQSVSTTPQSGSTTPQSGTPAATDRPSTPPTNPTSSSQTNDPRSATPLSFTEKSASTATPHLGPVTSGLSAAAAATPSLSSLAGGAIPAAAPVASALSAASAINNLASTTASLAQGTNPVTAPSPGSSTTGTPNSTPDLKSTPPNTAPPHSGTGNPSGTGAPGSTPPTPAVGGTPTPPLPPPPLPVTPPATPPPGLAPTPDPLARAPLGDTATATSAGGYPLTPLSRPPTDVSSTSRYTQGGAPWQGGANLDGSVTPHPLSSTHPQQELIDTATRLLQYVLSSDWVSRENYPPGVEPYYAISVHMNSDDVPQYFYFSNQGRGWTPPGVLVPQMAQLGWETVPATGRSAVLGRSDPAVQALRHAESLIQENTAGGRHHRLIAVVTSREIREEVAAALLRANDKIVGDIALAAESHYVDPSTCGGSLLAQVTTPLEHRLEKSAPDVYRRLAALNMDKDAQAAQLATDLAIDTVEASFAYDRPAFLDIVGALQRCEPITETMIDALQVDIVAAVNSAEIERVMQELKPLHDQKLVKYASDHTRISAGIALLTLLHGSPGALLDIAYEHYSTHARPDKIVGMINQVYPISPSF